MFGMIIFVQLPKAYAELFKLDSGKVIDGYLENISSLKN